MASLSADERSELRRRAGEAADAVHAWLDGLGSEPMSPAAAAFMYLLLAVEEMD